MLGFGAISEFSIDEAGPVEFTLALDAGSYAVTGQAVGLEWDRVLAAEMGAYTITGQDVAFEWTHILVADTGTYTVTGQDVGLSRRRLHGPLRQVRSGKSIFWKGRSDV